MKHFEHPRRVLVRESSSFIMSHAWQKSKISPLCSTGESHYSGLSKATKQVRGQTEIHMGDFSFHSLHTADCTHSVIYSLHMPRCTLLLFIASPVSLSMKIFTLRPETGGGESATVTLPPPVPWTQKRQEWNRKKM